MHRASLAAAMVAALVGTGVTATPFAVSADELLGIGSDVLDTGTRTTVGLGVGALYGGLGLNVGRVDGTRLTYGSLGCLALSHSGDTIQTAGDVTTTIDDSSTGTNCGLGAGILSTAFLAGTRHGLGLNLGLTYDTTYIGGPDEVQWHLRPTYNYFFGGIGSGGFNLGFSPVLTFDGGGTDPGLLLNLGYQF